MVVCSVVANIPISCKESKHDLIEIFKKNKKIKQNRMKENIYVDYLDKKNSNTLIKLVLLMLQFILIPK